MYLHEHDPEVALLVILRSVFARLAPHFAVIKDMASVQLPARNLRFSRFSRFS
jgi:hypothetical protein